MTAPQPEFVINLWLRSASRGRTVERIQAERLLFAMTAWVEQHGLAIGGGFLSATDESEAQLLWSLHRTEDGQASEQHVGSDQCCGSEGARSTCRTDSTADGQEVYFLGLGIQSEAEADLVDARQVEQCLVYASEHARMYGLNLRGGYRLVNVDDLKPFPLRPIP